MQNLVLKPNNYFGSDGCKIKSEKSSLLPIVSIELPQSEVNHERPPVPKNMTKFVSA